MPCNHVIVGAKKTGPQVWKGKAMLQIHTNSLLNMNSPYDLGIIMPSADKAERFNTICLTRAGSSGRLEPGAPICILE